VPTKAVEQQSCLMLHRARHLFIRQQTAFDEMHDSDKAHAFAEELSRKTGLPQRTR